jgi:SulP family sulfate permease
MHPFGQLSLAGFSSVENASARSLQMAGPVTTTLERPSELLAEQTKRKWIHAASRGSTLLSRILPNLCAGAISGTLVVTFGISLAAAIFTGPLAPYLPAGIGILLGSSCLLGAAAAFQSSFKPIIAAPQENTAIVLALIAAAIAQNVRSPENAFPTVVVAMALATIATGVLFLALGLLRLGKLVRFIPYPVIGGFLAGSGWLLAQGSLSVMIDGPVAVRDLHALGGSSALIRWIPGVAFGITLTFATRRFRHFLVLPGILAAGIAVFYAGVIVSGIGVAEASARGWLLGPFPEGALVHPFTRGMMSHVDWMALRISSPGIGVVTVLAGISFLLNATGLELATGAELDLDRELRATGIANLACGFLGGVPGYLSLSESAMNHRIGARSRAAGLVSAAICAISVVAGASALGYFPKPILGGLLFFFGLSFLLETVYDSFFRLPGVEYALILLMLGIIVIAGFLQGVGMGIVVSSVLFAVSYARVDVVKRAASGAVLRSKADRSPAHEAVLLHHGECLQVLQLQGYVFFGTAHYLLERVRQRLASHDSTRVEFLVLDFRQVHGLDASAIVGFSRLRKLAEDAGAVVVFTDLPAAVRRSLARGGGIDEEAEKRESDEVPKHLVLPDLDHGLEWCEDRLLLAKAGPPSEPPERDDKGALRGALLSAILGYFERVEVPPGHALYRKGDVADDLYLIESGELEAWLELTDGRPMRLRTMGPGNVVGEAGLYLGEVRSASVRTTQHSVLHRLSAPALEQMTEEAPRLAAEFQRLVATLLAARLVSTTSAPQSFFY